MLPMMTNGRLFDHSIAGAGTRCLTPETRHNPNVIMRRRVPVGCDGLWAVGWEPEVLTVCGNPVMVDTAIMLGAEWVPGHRTATCRCHAPWTPATGVSFSGVGLEGGECVL